MPKFAFMKTLMINRSEYRRAGMILRTHGREGGLLVSWEASENPFDNQELHFIFIDIDGHFIPFYIVNLQPGPGEREILFLEDIHTPEDAARYTGKAYYIHENFLKNIQAPFVGIELQKFKVVDIKFGILGLVTAIGGTEENPLLEVTNGNKDILIPLNGDFILGLDEKSTIITVDIPEDLLRLN